jgi:hypothetical protein
MLRPESFSTSLDDGLKLTMEWTLDRLNSATPRTFLLQHRHQMLSRVPANDGWALMGKGESFLVMKFLR